ncbi:hypothetical protein KP014_11740 [Paenibacillus sophorae]|uniref:Uncharacterized protein n=1 Tax=Paenibacillus sophorae TaxID=1333845 RepID=A0ABX8HI31_9BACL|nr:hypothetical protein [Paenibacillus sophorae]QWU17738.1 hypothetical protein KP014_11740 [Paenibacillus sophorae]
MIINNATMEKSTQHLTHREETPEIESVTGKQGCRSSLRSSSLNFARYLKAGQSVEDTGRRPLFLYKVRQFIGRLSRFVGEAAGL